ncbi:MAG TPA: dihydrofolate reductase [Papillibacter sp.]|jgi:dihydrofolate reductase|nr:dihydrofolate reductase [Papillibacter sp.]
MNVIVAVDNNWGIGKDGTQNIIIPEDRKYFREKTLGSTIIVGRRTVLDFPGQKPLPGRRNIILSRNPSFSIEGATVASSIDEVFRETAHDENVFVVGGAMVFHLLLNYCDTAYITKFYTTAESDVYFPNLDAMPNWVLRESSDVFESQGITFAYHRYENVSPLRYTQEAR